MRQIIFRKVGGPEVLELDSFEPRKPGENEVSFRPSAIGVSWPDTLVRSGRYRWMPPLPAVPGHEASGTIEAVGPGVRNLRVGQKAYVTNRALSDHDNRSRQGFYVEQMTIPAHAIVPLPDHADVDESIALGYYAYGWAMLHETNGGRRPKSVLITGAAGMMSTALVQLAHHYGIEVFGTISSPEKAAFAKQNGADHTINYKTENVVERVKEITKGKGVEMIIDHIAGPTFTDNFEMLGKWGMIVTINTVNGPPEKSVYDAWRASSRNCTALRSFVAHIYDDDAEGRERIMTPVLKLFSEGKLRAPIAGSFALEQAVEAHKFLESGKGLGRILLRP